MDGIRKYFIQVKGKFDGIGYDEAYVPTREEYNDFRERVCYYTDELTKRIEALESKNKKDDEEKRLWKICIYSSISRNTYFSDTRELTESEAVEWYKKYNKLALIKDGLLYKKDGEWVTYEITK